MKRTVIIGIDSSVCANYAFDFYIDHVHLEEDNIILVHVSEYSSLVRAPALSDPVVVRQLVEEEERKMKVLVEKYAQKLRSKELAGKVKNVAGKCGECIVSVAKEEKAGLIVLGTRGLGTFRRTLLGSVSDYVLHHAHVPVLVCHDNRSHDQEQELDHKET